MLTIEDASNLFAAAFDNANGRYGVSWNLTMGLYWIRPYYFLSLDKGSQNYIANKLGITIGRHGPKRRCNSADYLAVIDALELGFQEDSYPAHSFPELSFEAWGYKVPTTLDNNEEEGDDDDEDENAVQDELYIAPARPYTIENIIDDGCFLSRPKLEQYLDRLNKKKNLILQGPPGTGKTWLAKRLAYALDETVVIQGHAIRFATVDLTASAAEIRARLLQLCEPALAGLEPISPQTDLANS